MREHERVATGNTDIDGSRTPAHTLWLLAVVLIAAPSARSADAWQSPESIRDAAERYAESRLAADPTTQIESAGIDSRLRLPACGNPLEARMHGGFGSGRGTVAVSCSGPERWELFVPVRVFQIVDVAVADRPIAAGEIIGADAVRLERRPSAGLPHLAARGLDGVLGQRARHTIGAGNVIQITALDISKAVERGAIVTLKTRRAGIAVHGEGEALESGAIGARIRLRTPAGRVVEGTVVSDKEVRVGG
jgi:flagella basal body P-ring formation protein FlgA